MKVSDDQKKTVTALAIYPVCYIAGAVLYHSLKGDIDRTDILWRSAWSTVVAVLIAVFFIMG